jgi:hypothetical protein
MRICSQGALQNLQYSLSRLLKFQISRMPKFPWPNIPVWFLVVRNMPRMFCLTVQELRPSSRSCWACVTWGQLLPTGKGNAILRKVGGGGGSHTSADSAPHPRSPQWSFPLECSARGAARRCRNAKRQVGGCNCEMYTDTSLYRKAQSLPVTSPEASQGQGKFGLPSKIWHSAQFGGQGCQLYAPAALYQQGNSLGLTSLRAWVDPRVTDCGQKEYVTWKFPRTLQGLEPGTSFLVVQCENMVASSVTQFWRCGTYTRTAAPVLTLSSVANCRRFMVALMAKQLSTTRSGPVPAVKASSPCWQTINILTFTLTAAHSLQDRRLQLVSDVTYLNTPDSPATRATILWTGTPGIICTLADNWGRV